jgi:hypothetical protein
LLNTEEVAPLNAMETTAYLPAASDCSLTAMSEVMKGRKRHKSTRGEHKETNGIDAKK